MSTPDANGWTRITGGEPPLDIVDVWLWDCEEPKSGRLVPGVRILHTWEPFAIEFQDQDGRWVVYPPDENGEWVSHYRPATKPPVMP